jgi:hypothetical protein
MKNKFTIEEWLTLLEPGVQDKALAYRRKQMQKMANGTSSYQSRSLAEALGMAFIWDRTPERHAFWERVRDNALKETRKPANNRGMIDCTIQEEGQQ